VLVGDGLSALNVDRVARAAGAGKTAVRTRWPDLLDLAAEVVLTAGLVRPVTDPAELAEGWSAPLGLPERAAATLLGADRHHPVLRAAFARAVDEPLAELAGALVGGAGRPDVVRSALVVRVLRAQLVGRLTAGPLPRGTADEVVRDVLGPLLRAPGG
jgi:AcrR family transcriptional regulator